MTYLRFFHASINCPKIDFYINGVPIEENYDYKQMSEYFSGRAGLYNLEIKLSNENKIILKKEIDLKENNIYTIAITGLLKNINAKLISDDIKHEDGNKSNSMIRFINLSPSLKTADIKLNGGNITKLDFNKKSNYFEFEPDKHTLEIKDQEKTLKNKNIKLDSGKVYSSYILGVNTLTNSLEIVTHMEGKSFLNYYS